MRDEHNQFWWSAACWVEYDKEYDDNNDNGNNVVCRGSAHDEDDIPMESEHSMKLSEISGGQYSHIRNDQSRLLQWGAATAMLQCIISTIDGITTNRLQTNYPGYGYLSRPASPDLSPARGTSLINYFLRNLLGFAELVVVNGMGARGLDPLPQTAWLCLHTECTKMYFWVEIPQYNNIWPNLFITIAVIIIILFYFSWCQIRNLNVEYRHWKEKSNNWTLKQFQVIIV